MGHRKFDYNCCWFVIGINFILWFMIILLSLASAIVKYSYTFWPQLFIKIYYQ
jgi:hypothetical protein